MITNLLPPSIAAVPISCSTQPPLISLVLYNHRLLTVVSAVSVSHSRRRDVAWVCDGAIDSFESRCHHGLQMPVLFLFVELFWFPFWLLIEFELLLRRRDSSEIDTEVSYCLCFSISVSFLDFRLFSLKKSPSLAARCREKRVHGPFSSWQLVHCPWIFSTFILSLWIN
jgi:hypothetical protein